MTRVVKWSEEALADFEDQFGYIARDSLSNAHLVADRIEHSITLLATTPFGRAGRVSGTYEALVPRTPFIVVYELTDGKTLGIRRIIHTSRHWPEGGWPEDN